MVDENVISESTIEKVNKEIEKMETNTLEQKMAAFAKQQEEMFKKQTEESQKRFDEELKKRDEQLNNMKAGFEKQLDSISTRKSVSTNDIVAAQAQTSAPKAYKELSKDEKDQADADWFRQKGIPL
jgi:hypothetical protein